MKKLFSIVICVMALLFSGCSNVCKAKDGQADILKSKAFSVSASKQVTFSKGNLQYTQSTDTWSFAENQWDYIGTDNVTGGRRRSSGQYGVSKIGTALADKIDLFGWSSSTGSTKFGASTDIAHSDYSGSFVDWGTNKIGADAPNTWRTLTRDEWNYLLHTRLGAGHLKGVAQVNGVHGLILLPDNWSCPSGITFEYLESNGFSDSDFATCQTFTADQWSKLESAGAVFLPAAGCRCCSEVRNVQFYGYYWSATEMCREHAYHLYFYSGDARMSDFWRGFGRSVRLVKDLQ